MLFADDAALVAHTEEELQQLLSQFSHACKEFGLTISIKKTNVLSQNVPSPPSISIDGEVLENTDHFKYLGSTITSHLSLDKEIDTRIARAAAILSKLNKKVWENNNISLNTKLRVYQACVLNSSSSSETWTTYARQENRLNSFHLRCLRRILGINWEDKITNTSVLEQTNSHSMYLLITQRRLRWIGHVRRMKDGRIPKDILYGELATGHRPVGRPALRYKDVLKRDLKTTGISLDTWEPLAENRRAWRTTVSDGIQRGEAKRLQQLKDKRSHRKEGKPSHDFNPPSSFVCLNCGRDCHARIGLLSHSRCCQQQN